MKNNPNLSVIMMGATGAVGSEAVKTLLQMTQIKRLTLLGRRPVENMNSNVVEQHKIDVRDLVINKLRRLTEDIFCLRNLKKVTTQVV
ncbi:MAG: FlaA1/EpsC-like NDP-sugar epimerase [Saprospiraceae bacterium]|jgi:FlaA1/EpsC-like NDP-sugar epimerase